MPQWFSDDKEPWHVDNTYEQQQTILMILDPNTKVTEPGIIIPCQLP